ncbi:hypothetical protein HNQ02_003779, partial [Flavobacterium sp. 7E]|nr:hypothetical protein [Flavobacterium sp. 7E]
MFNLWRKSLAIEIDSFINHLNSKLESKPIKNFTKSAFVQKRQKINPEVFKYLSKVIMENTYVEININVQLFYGYRLLAVDGSMVILPYTENLKNVFGVSKNNTKTVLVQGRASVLY